MSITQRLAVSALLCVNESLIESGRLSHFEVVTLQTIIAAVRDSFEDTAPHLPTLIIADPDFDATLERVSDEMAAS